MKARDSRWTRWRHKTTAAVDALAITSGGGGLPVRLSNIAHARKVRDVVFRPLLVDGCLGVRADGFVIFVRCDKHKTADLNKAWNDEDSAHRTLPPRIRFTIAHEIAHTFFFNVETSPPKATVILDASRTVDSLEYSCNHLAARMLLPEGPFQHAVRTTNVLDPTALRDLASRSGVSPHVLTVRLKDSFDWSDNFGAVLCVRQDESGPVIVAAAMHYSFRGLFGSDRKKLDLADLLNDSTLVVNGGGEIEVTRQFSCLVGKQRASQEFLWRCEDSLPLMGSTYFVTVKRVGDLQLLNAAAT
jgi:IrrE N-terminal-like domain